MGRPKEWLPLGSETMLQRVVRLLGEAVEPVVVVAAAGQVLPELPAGVAVLRDRVPDRGPLEGIAVGLAAVAGAGADAAFVASCDLPLLRPPFVHRMIELSDGHDVTVPHVDGRDHPLAAVYRTDLLPRIESLLSTGQRRTVELFHQARTRRVTPAELADVDPALESLINVNTPADYEQVLRALRLTQ
jgi:molybdenum cofactor guanylyltransferase